MDDPCTAEILIRRMVSEYGFRSGDYTASWDGGQFDPARQLHELRLATRDGKCALAVVRVPAKIADNSRSVDPTATRAGYTTTLT
jgi:hypothetical protein